MELKEKGYETKKGRIKKPKEIKVRCNCCMKCFEHVEDEKRKTKTIFDDFYNLPTHDQDEFMSETVKGSEKVRERIGNKTKNCTKTSRRKCTRKYFLCNNEKKLTEVCQKMYT